MRRPTRRSARLIVASSEASADLLYTLRCFVPDEVIWFQKGGRTHVVLSPLEYDRVSRKGNVDVAHSLSDYEKPLTKRLGRRPRMEELILAVLRKQGLRYVEVPASFPLGYAEHLRASGIQVEPNPESFFPMREFKSPEEVRHIQKAQRMAEAGLERGIEILRASRVMKGGFLSWSGRRLTSEILRGEIDATVVREGGLPAHTIVAGGKQACDPHEAGFGPLKAKQTIILDIFPRAQSTGYFGDLTRTVIKGTPTEAQQRLYDTVLAAQQMALREMKPGVDGAALHQRVQDFFTDQSYPTRQRKGRWEGFFHGTGHSLGLEIHEPPRFGATRFQAGHVMTVEPGLYYPDIGGVRIEDLVVLRHNGIRNLTSVPKFFRL